MKVYHQLESLLDLLNMPHNSDRSNGDVIAALLGNPSTPATLRSRLWEQNKNALDKMGRYLQDANLRMALAFNPNVAEAERNRYFQDLIATGGNVWDKLAKNPQTPPEILEELLKQGKEKSNIASNPSTPEVLLKCIADNYDYLWRNLAENPSTPVDLLFRFINETRETQDWSNPPIFNLVINNPNLPPVDRYRLLLEKEEAEINAKANKLMLHRRNNPYDWGQKTS